MINPELPSPILNQPLVIPVATETVLVAEETLPVRKKSISFFDETLPTAVINQELPSPIPDQPLEMPDETEIVPISAPTQLVTEKTIPTEKETIPTTIVETIAKNIATRRSQILLNYSPVSTSPVSDIPSDSSDETRLIKEVENQTAEMEEIKTKLDSMQSDMKLIKEASFRHSSDTR